MARARGGAAGVYLGKALLKETEEAQWITNKNMRV